MARRADPPYPRFWAGTREAWRAWLEANANEANAVWLVTSKKNSGEPHLPYAEAAEEALAFGWIDSLPRKLDENRSMLLVTPRKPGSSWSAVNKERVERLSAAGLMTEAGLAKIQAAKTDGSWDRLNEVDALIVPPDLQMALAENPQAALHWEDFAPSSRRGILEWLLNAKRPETRARRVAETVRLAAQNRKANHPG